MLTSTLQTKYLKNTCFCVLVWHLIRKLSTNKQVGNITSRITSWKKHLVKQLKLKAELRDLLLKWRQCSWCLNILLLSLWTWVIVWVTWGFCVGKTLKETPLTQNVCSEFIQDIQKAEKKFQVLRSSCSLHVISLLWEESNQLLLKKFWKLPWKHPWWSPFLAKVEFSDQRLY